MLFGWGHHQPLKERSVYNYRQPENLPLFAPLPTPSPSQLEVLNAWCLVISASRRWEIISTCRCLHSWACADMSCISCELMVLRDGCGLMCKDMHLHLLRHSCVAVLQPCTCGCKLSGGSSFPSRRWKMQIMGRGRRTENPMHMWNSFLVFWSFGCSKKILNCAFCSCFSEQLYAWSGTGSFFLIFWKRTWEEQWILNLHYATCQLCIQNLLLETMLWLLWKIYNLERESAHVHMLFLFKDRVLLSFTLSHCFCLFSAFQTTRWKAKHLWPLIRGHRT